MSKRMQKNSNRASKFTNGQIIMTAICILVLGVFVGTMVVEGGSSRKRVKATATQEIFSTHAIEIAGEFRCSCGTCGEINLAVCTCETALVEKRYIENSLKSGKSHAQITNQMIKIYGFHNET
ncbi:MAG: hypothetical protein HQ508_04130 [Candidatus Marinimicrobia bacterium]|nr:hypothetical protein [Candidatus Neomarinimicrobiota bacterium]